MELKIRINTKEGPKVYYMDEDVWRRQQEYRRKLVAVFPKPCNDLYLT